MPIAAHRCTLSYISGKFGTTGDACSLVSGTTYAVSSARKNSVFYPSESIAVYDGGVSVAGAFTVNTLGAQITLDSAPSGAVTADFGYMALQAALEVREFAINLSRDELEDTVFGDNDKSYLMGLKGGTGTISGLDVLSTVFQTTTDADGLTNSIETIHNNDRLFVLSVQLNPDTRRTFRAFVKIPTLDLSGARDGLVEGNFPFTITEVVSAKESTGKASYSFFNTIA